MDKDEKKKRNEKKPKKNGANKETELKQQEHDPVVIERSKDTRKKWCEAK